MGATPISGHSPRTYIKENAKIVISPSALLLSKDEVSANENVTIRGTGFGDGKGCLVSAQISGAKLVLVSEDGVDSDCRPPTASTLRFPRLASSRPPWPSGPKMTATRR